MLKGMLNTQPSSSSDSLFIAPDKVLFFQPNGVVGWCGVLYLTSPGRPTDIGLHLGKARCPCSRYRYWGNAFISSVSSLLFLFVLLPCSSLSSLLLSLLSLFSPSLGDDTKWPTKLDMSLNPNTISQFQPESTHCSFLFLHRSICYRC